MEKFKVFSQLSVRKILIVFLLLTVPCTLYPVPSVYAELEPIKPIGVSQPKTNAGIQVGTNECPDSTFERVLNAFIQLFFLIGAIGVLIMFLWGGVNWILSGGDKEKVASARKRITSALIGVVLLAFGFAITYTIGTMIGINPLSRMEIPTLTGRGCVTPPSTRDPNS